MNILLFIYHNGLLIGLFVVILMTVKELLGEGNMLDKASWFIQGKCDKCGGDLEAWSTKKAFCRKGHKN